MDVSATKGGQSWKLSYLYDEEDTVYGVIYRDPATSAAPLAIGIVTTDRGDVVELLDANGAAFAAYRYDAWGSPVGGITDVWGRPTGIGATTTTLITTTALAQTIAERQVLRYASCCWDPESRLYYCSSRSYDPATRQWLSKDPVKADGEESSYQYCCGDPVGSIDPNGEHKKAVPKIHQHVKYKGEMKYNWCWAACIRSVVQYKTGQTPKLSRIVKVVHGNYKDLAGNWFDCFAGLEHWGVSVEAVYTLPKKAKNAHSAIVDDHPMLASITSDSTRTVMT